MLSLSIRKLCTHSQSTYGVYTLQAHVGFKIFKFSREIFFFILTLSTHVSGFTLHTVIWFTLSKQMLGSKFSNFHGSFFFILTLSTHVSGFTLHTVIWFTLSKHMLGSKFSNFHRISFFSYLHSPHMFQGSLSIQLFGLHSPSTCLVQHFQIFMKDHFFMLTLSTHVLGFTLHTVIWFTLSKHMLGSKFLNFHRIFLFILTLSTHVSEFTLHAVVFTLSKQMLHFKIVYSYYNFIICLNAPLNHECLTP